MNFAELLKIQKKEKLSLDYSDTDEKSQNLMVQSQDLKL